MNEGNSKSLLPLVEILISIGIFAVAVVLTLKLFLLASFLGHKTSDTARAIFEVQNIAETIKTIKTGVDMDEYFINELNGNNKQGNIYYDNEWNPIDITDENAVKEAVYNLKIDEFTDEGNSGILYTFKLELFKTAPYPFIDDIRLKNDANYIPVLVAVEASKFIIK